MRRSFAKTKSRRALWRWLLLGVGIIAVQLGVIAVYVVRGAVDHALLLLFLVLIVCHFMLRRYADASSDGEGALNGEAAKPAERQSGTRRTPQ